MSNHDHWLEYQGGCYDQLPSCPKCGYEWCDHGVCRYCLGCAECETAEAEEQFARKPSVSVPSRAEQRRIV